MEPVRRLIHLAAFYLMLFRSLLANTKATPTENLLVFSTKFSVGGHLGAKKSCLKSFSKSGKSFHSAFAGHFAYVK